MIILGIDPGLIKTGYGIIKVYNDSYNLVDCGTIVPHPKKPLSQRLKTIYKDILYIIDKYNPSIMAIEEVFYGKNVKSSLLLGHARGVSMVCGSMREIPVFEYSARKVKQSVTGNGNAHKSQVKYMISKEFNISDENFSTDASDALAIASCHLNQIKVNEL